METDKSRLKSLAAFAKSIEISDIDLELLNTALTHRSYLNENRSKQGVHNERLEFLGDAVLELVVSEHLFNTYTEHPEGELTSFRAATVKTDTLAEVSRRMGMGEMLLMSKGEELTGGRDKDYLLANTYESVLGAIYLSLGMERCRKYVGGNLITLISEIVEHRLDIDAKTKFQEVAQSLYKHTPTYNLKHSKGPDHEKIFTMVVSVGDREFGEGTGLSKQKAEEAAAQSALEMLNKMDKSNKIA